MSESNAHSDAPRAAVRRYTRTTIRTGRNRDHWAHGGRTKLRDRLPSPSKAPGPRGERNRRRTRRDSWPSRQWHAAGDPTHAAPISINDTGRPKPRAHRARVPKSNAATRHLRDPLLRQRAAHCSGHLGVGCKRLGVQVEERLNGSEAVRVGGPASRESS